MGSIYKITNTVNGKAYIGQTRHDAEKTRIRDHLTGNSKANQLVKRAVEKYGKDVFTYEILHDGIIPDFLDMLEIEAIEKYNTMSPRGYNLTTGGSTSGYKHSPETRQKISDALKGRPGIKGRTPWNKGKRGVQKHSETTRQKMSESQKNSPLAIEERKKVNQRNVGKKRSPETKVKMSKAANKREAKKRAEGYTVTEATRQKISKGLKGKYTGEKSPMYGKLVSPETRQKISEFQKNSSQAKEHLRKLAQMNTGKSCSPETKRKISEANTGKKRSAEDRRKMSEVNKNRSPYRTPAREFFDTLPSDMNLKDKRLYLYDEFPSVKKKTIQKWVRQWQSEKHN